MVKGKPRRSAAHWWLLALQIGLVSTLALADTVTCGDPFVNHYGPFDYRTARAEDKNIVERVHFTPETEQLKVGTGSGFLAQDIGYTLHVFPNHPRALLAMSRLAIREKTAKPQHAKYSVDCYFDRAIRFRPDDGGVYMVYGIYLLKIGQRENAIAALQKSVALSGDNANVHYNLGLAYFELKDYEKALAHAHRAYALGFPLPGLRTMLERAGKWRGAPPPTGTP